MNRILHVTGRMNRGGAETMIMNLYRSIDRTQFQFDFVSFSQMSGDYDEEIIALGGRIFKIVTTNPIVRMFMLEKFLKAHKEYSIVHCHTLLGNAFHSIAAKRAGVANIISHSHSTTNLSNRGFLSLIYQNWALKTIRKYSTHFFSCGIEAASFLFPDVKSVTLIPNSVDVQFFADIALTNKDYLRKEFRLSNDTLIILQLGRLIELKNHNFSIEIAKQLKKKCIDFSMFFVGQGELRDKLVQNVKIHDLDKNIFFLGLRTDVSQLLAGSDIMLMPSLYEGFPVVLVESQAAGIPALIADTISKEVDLGVGLINFESLRHGPEVWVDSISKILNSKALKSNRIEIMKNKKFDISESVRILTDLYKSML